jgi:hypothetical protein
MLVYILSHVLVANKLLPVSRERAFYDVREQECVSMTRENLDDESEAHEYTNRRTQDHGRAEDLFAGESTDTHTAGEQGSRVQEIRAHRQVAYTRSCRGRISSGLIASTPC